MMDNNYLEVLKDLKILYVEDDADIRHTMGILLRKYCNNVIEANNGKDALIAYKNHKPNIMITDLNMPVVSGIELIRTIRKDIEDESLCILVTTAHKDEHYLLDATELHLEKYLVKPVSIEKLVEALGLCVKKCVKNHTLSVDLGYGLVYDKQNRQVLRNGNDIKLGKKEIKFLELLIDNKNEVVEYQKIEDIVWQGANMSHNALRALVSTLRSKLDSDNSKLIENLSGFGYKLNI
jgi:DNA-binding response OmpR family regulator